MTISTVASRRDSRMGGLVLCFAPKNETFGFLKNGTLYSERKKVLHADVVWQIFFRGGGKTGWR